MTCFMCIRRVLGAQRAASHSERTYLLMDTDDRQIGRILGRREALALLGGFGAGVAGLSLVRSTFAQATTPMCVVRPELTEGPYFVDDQLDRSDIRTEPSDGSVKPGVPLIVAFQILRVGGSDGCSGLSGAQVDIWHCDALGIYSGQNGFLVLGALVLGEELYETGVLALIIRRGEHG